MYFVWRLIPDVLLPENLRVSAGCVHAQVATPLSQCHNPNLVWKRNGTKTVTFVWGRLVRFLRGFDGDTR